MGHQIWEMVLISWVDHIWGRIGPIGQHRCKYWGRGWLIFLLDSVLCSTLQKVIFLLERSRPLGFGPQQGQERGVGGVGRGWGACGEGRVPLRVMTAAGTPLHKWDRIIIPTHTAVVYMLHMTFRGTNKTLERRSLAFQCWWLLDHFNSAFPGKKYVWYY